MNEIKNLIKKEKERYAHIANLQTTLLSCRDEAKVQKIKEELNKEIYNGYASTYELISVLSTDIPEESMQKKIKYFRNVVELSFFLENSLQRYGVYMESKDLEELAKLIYRFIITKASSEVEREERDVSYL